MKFDYEKEPSRDILCIDCKSFYASVECAERGLDPLKTMLVVMSNAENAGGLVLSASPIAKKVLGVSNVTRKNQVPAHPDLYVVPPRMNLYMKKNQEINNLYKEFVADEDHSEFSVDESFLDVTASFEDLGKTPQKDLAAEKATYPSLLGLEQSHTILNDSLDKARAIFRQLEADKGFKPEKIIEILERLRLHA